jgi:hypothetical protein
MFFNMTSFRPESAAEMLTTDPDLPRPGARFLHHENAEKVRDHALLQ